MRMLRMKSWSSYQSYKDRKPPWIRLHKSLLDNFEYLTMSLTGRAVLPLLWLLASEDHDPVSGLIRDSNEKISFRLRLPIEEITAGINECERAGFLESIQEVTEQYPICNQSVTPETEERREETEKRQRHKNDFSAERKKHGSETKPTSGTEVIERMLHKFDATLEA